MSRGFSPAARRSWRRPTTSAPIRELHRRLRRGALRRARNRSDSGARTRAPSCASFFEVDRRHIALAALQALVEEGTLSGRRSPRRTDATASMRTRRRPGRAESRAGGPQIESRSGGKRRRGCRDLSSRRAFRLSLPHRGAARRRLSVLAPKPSIMGRNSGELNRRCDCGRLPNVETFVYGSPQGNRDMNICIFSERRYLLA